MNLIKGASLTLTAGAMLIAACGVSKKASGPKHAAASPAATSGVRSATGIFVPGEQELTAIGAKYHDVTLKTLTEGYTLYTGVCAGCHRPKSIYSRSEASWPRILDDMARKAGISDAQKDAVYKYVLAIKATQPKSVD